VIKVEVDTHRVRILTIDKQEGDTVGWTSWLANSGDRALNKGCKKEL